MRLSRRASKVSEASFVSSFNQALGCSNFNFNFPTVIMGLSGIRGKLWLTEISISC